MKRKRSPSPDKIPQLINFDDLCSDPNLWTELRPHLSHLSLYLLSCVSKSFHSLIWSTLTHLKVSNTTFSLSKRLQNLSQPLQSLSCIEKPTQEILSLI